MINIHGPWTSKNGMNRIRIIQKWDKFEGWVGNQEDSKISLGSISGRTLNFKQSWHKGVNKGAVATVYGRLTSDNGNILLEFVGMRADGREIKGRSAIYRDNLIGSWIPMSGGSGDTWLFNMLNERDITGYYDSNRFNDRVMITGHRNQEDGNFFIVYLKVNGITEEVRGEYRCPNLKLSLPQSFGRQTQILVRKPPESLPPYQEYEPESSQTTTTDSKTNLLKGLSFSSRNRPCRFESQFLQQTHDESQHYDDIQSAFLQVHDRQYCCCCYCNMEIRSCCILQ